MFVLFHEIWASLCYLTRIQHTYFKELKKITNEEEDTVHIKWMKTANNIKLPNSQTRCCFFYSFLLVPHEIPIAGYFYRACIWSGKVGLDKKKHFTYCLYHRCSIKKCFVRSKNIVSKFTTKDRNRTIYPLFSDQRNFNPWCWVDRLTVVPEN